MKLNLPGLGAAIGAAILVAPQALAAPDTVTDNVRCVVASLAATGSSDPAIAQAGTISALYFVGRLDGQDPTFDLEGALIAQIKRMTPADIQAEAKRCGALLSVRGKSLTDLGDDLKRRDVVGPS